MDPLTAEDVVVAQRAPTFAESIRDLLDAAIEATLGISATSSKGRWPSFLERRLDRNLEPAWANDETRFGSVVSAWTYSLDEDLEAPAFWIGIWFEDASAEAEAALLDRAWQEQLPGQVRAGEPGDPSIGCWKYLSELVVAGRTFDDQVEALVAWAQRAMDDVRNVPPPPVAPAVPPAST